jgi:hypothetical protein
MNHLVQRLVKWDYTWSNGGPTQPTLAPTMLEGRGWAAHRAIL